jgi:LPXTG-site transpeptidase (sortase) family protein
MLPFSGLMILFSILMFGLALAIPASRAIQEAQMRDRIAGGVAAAESDDKDNGDQSGNGAAMPLVDESDDEADPADEGSRAGAPPAIEEITRGVDVATRIESFRGSEQADNGEPAAQRKPKPAHIRIPAVEIDAEIHQVGYSVIEVGDQRVREWEVASYAAGHHKTSARPGEGGNIVVTGHNDWEGEVFRTLEYAKHGQEIFITTEAGEHRYVIQEIHMRREVGVSMEERLETGRFMAEMPEERLTLITCWPYGINDHRIIVVAVPAE